MLGLLLTLGAAAIVGVEPVDGICNPPSDAPPVVNPELPVDVGWFGCKIAEVVVLTVGSVESTPASDPPVESGTGSSSG